MIEDDHIPENLRDLIAAEKARPDPGPEVGQRIYARLAAGLGLPPMLNDAAPSAPAPAPAPALPVGPAATAVAEAVANTSARVTLRGLLTFVVGAAVGATTYGTVQHLRHGSEPAAAPTVTVPAPAPPPPILPSPPPVAQPETARPAAVPGHSREAEPRLLASRDRALAAERKLVEMARSALARGQIAGALATLQRHARVFPGGQLAEERDSLLVQTLVAQGDYAKARDRATHFHRQYPHSLFAPVVDQALRSIP